MTLLETDSLHAIVRQVMLVERVASLQQPRGGLLLQGRLHLPPAEAMETIAPPLRDAGYLGLLDRHKGEDQLTIVPYVQPQHRTRPVLAAVLLALTAISVLFVGAGMVQPDMDSILRHPFSGWPFAISMLAILGAHEMGHFIVARRGGVLVSLPYFIPMPIGPFGTMGAFINMRSVPRNRAQILKIGMAGPLCGLVVTLIVLMYGLSTSPVGPLPDSGAYVREGNSLLYLLLKRAVLGRWLPAGGVDVMLSPVAFAGWAGLMVTGLNLIPAAQLDGGHVAYAILGARARYLTLALAAAMLVLGFAWEGWFIWSVLIFVLGSRPQVVQDAVTPLARRQQLAAVLMLLLAVLLFPPVPLAIVQP